MPRSNRYNTSGVRRCRSEIEATQNRALTLRETTNMTLRQIASECGYVHPVTGEPRPQSADMAIRAAQARRATGTTTVTSTPTAVAEQAVRTVRQQATNGLPSNRTFGVEIEFFNLTPQQAVRALTNAGVSASFEGYTHRVMNTWKIVTDASVNRVGTGGAGLELVSPVLRGADGLEQIEKVTKALREAGAKVDKTCGVHVHIGMDGLVGAEMMKVIDLYVANQSFIDGLMPASRRDAYYCRHITTDSLNLGIYNQMRNSRTATATTRMRTTLSGAQRFYVVNVASYAKYGTLEFRQHSGSLNGKKIGGWVQFLLGLVETATRGNTTTAFESAEALFTGVGVTDTVAEFLNARHTVMSVRR